MAKCEHPPSRWRLTTSVRTEVRKEWRGKLGAHRLKRVRYEVTTVTCVCGRCGIMMSAYQEEKEVK